MRRALELARTHLGKTAPNPSVGCVIVKDGLVVAEGTTGVGGAPHAEEIALDAAGDAAEGATVYVTLEPCRQRSSGRPSCSTRLIEAGVARTVIACRDPHPLADGGAARLTDLGVDVTEGVCEAEGRAVNAGFFKVVREGRPWLAIDADTSTYDADFSLNMRESFPDALTRMAKEGLTRVRVAPKSPLALALKAAGLVDEDLS